MTIMRFTAVAAVILASTPPSEAFAFARPLPSPPSQSSSICVQLEAAKLSLLRLSLRGGGGGGGDGGLPARCTSSLAALGTDTVNEVVTIPTEPIEGMRPGTSGLRKKVEVWMRPQYVENFIQSLIDTAADANEGKMLDT